MHRRREASWLLQAVRFLVANEFLQKDPSEPLVYPEGLPEVALPVQEQLRASAAALMKEDGEEQDSDVEGGAGEEGAGSQQQQEWEEEEEGEEQDEEGEGSSDDGGDDQEEEEASGSGLEEDDDAVDEVDAPGERSEGGNIVSMTHVGAGVARTLDSTENKLAAGAAATPIVHPVA